MKPLTNNSKSIAHNFNHPYTKSMVIWITTLCVLGVAGWAGEFLQTKWGVSSSVRYSIQAFVMSGLLVPIIWYITRFFDRDIIESIGFQKLRRSSFWFLVGAGLILTPMFITLGSTHLFGWGNIEINESIPIFSTITIGIITVFLFEALPEELAFRGYIFSQLNTMHNKWIAGTISVILFVLLPITLFNMQSLFLTTEMNVGSQTTLTGGYIITMLFFGSIVQYLRIITKTIWTGIGFHLAFVYSDRLVGVGPSDLIVISDASNQTAPQILLISLMLLTILAIVTYSFWKKKSALNIAL